MSSGSFKDERANPRLVRPPLPLAGAVLIGLTFKALPQRRSPASSASRPSGSRSSPRSSALRAPGPRRGGAPARLRRVGLREDRRRRRPALDPDRPAVGAMCLVVTGVSTLIHLYSISYMGGDRGYTRFFAYLNFFVFSMLLLVLAGELLPADRGLGVRRRGVLPADLFWYRRTTATRRHQGVRHQRRRRRRPRARRLLHLPGHRHARLPQGRSSGPARLRANDGDLVAGCILLLVGAFAKSAQVPLHTWLPDAMEGPTPVSALIHAATMVTAGVYLIARMHPLFEQAPDGRRRRRDHRLRDAADRGHDRPRRDRPQARHRLLDDVADRLHDHGRLGAPTRAGMFHLMTHAFFKALLFMAAGSVIAAMGGEQNLDKMGGFRKAMPFTFGCFVIGGLALAGIPPFSGFFSKDEILACVLRARRLATSCSACSATSARCMTAIYTFRMIFRAFFGEPCAEARGARARPPLPRAEPTNPATGEVEDTDVGFPGPEHHIAEQRAAMKVAMGVPRRARDRRRLPPDPGRHRGAPHFLEPTFADSRFSTDRARPTAPTSSASLVGAVLGARRHLRSPDDLRPGRQRRPRSRPASRRVHTFFVNKWYFDELIDFADRAPGRLARPLRAAPRSSGSSSTARWSAARRASSAPARPRCARSSPATCATTPRCCLIGLIGLVALLPVWPHDHPSEHPPLLPARPGPARRRSSPSALRAVVLVLGDAGRRSPTRSSLIADFDAGAGPAVRHRRRVDLRARHPLQARRRRPEPVADRAHHAARSPRRRCGSLLRPVERAAPVLLPLGARRDRGARRVPRPGPRAVRPLLRPDAGAVLLPRRQLGRRSAARAAAIKLVIYTLVGSLLMLAARDRDGGALAPTAATLIASSLSDLAAAPLAEGTQQLDLRAFALAFLIKMPAFPFHGWMPDAYRPMPLPALAIFSGVLSKVAAYGFLRIVAAAVPGRRERLPDADPRARAVVSILYGSAHGVHADQRAARPRLLVGRAARLHRARHLRPRPRGRRAGRDPADGQPRARGRAAVLHRRAARRARRRVRGHPRHGRPRLPRAGARRAVPDRRARDARDAGLGQLRRRVPDPPRALRRKLAIAIIAFTGVVLAAVYMLRLFIRAMHNRRRPDGDVVRAHAARRARARPARASAILAFALYPQLALRGEPGEAAGAQSDASAGGGREAP